MKNQALFSSKDKSKKLKCCLLQFLFGALRVNVRPFSFRLLSITIAKTCNLPVADIVGANMWVMINSVDNSIYRKNSKNWDTLNHYCDCPTNGIVGFYSAILRSKDADRITNRAGTDQTAP